MRIINSKFLLPIFVMILLIGSSCHSKSQNGSESLTEGQGGSELTLVESNEKETADGEVLQKEDVQASKDGDFTQEEIIIFGN